MTQALFAINPMNYVDSDGNSTDMVVHPVTSPPELEASLRRCLASGQRAPHIILLALNTEPAESDAHQPAWLLHTEQLVDSLKRLHHFSFCYALTGEMETAKEMGTAVEVYARNAEERGRWQIAHHQRFEERKAAALLKGENFCDYNMSRMQLNPKCSEDCQQVLEGMNATQHADWVMVMDCAQELPAEMYPYRVPTALTHFAQAHITKLNIRFAWGKGENPFPRLAGPHSKIPPVILPNLEPHLPVLKQQSQPDIKEEPQQESQHCHD